MTCARSTSIRSTCARCWCGPTRKRPPISRRCSPCRAWAPSPCALALTSELIYGERASTRDPARFSFAHGGKDGTPFPVDRATYDHTIETLHDAVARARLGHGQKMHAFKRLARFSSD